MDKQNLPLTILAIDTSCDETSVAVTRGSVVLANALYSQLELHKNYGGVVPSIAKLAHIEKFDSVLQEALDAADVSLENIEAVAVTQGPGLAIALEVGINKAKELAERLKVPLIGVNHMEGHLLSALALEKSEAEDNEIKFPALGLLVSGGHTEFIEVKEIGSYRKLGGTLDDACGEAYDKSARMLGLPYPGGPLISKLAEENREKLEVKFEKDQRSLMARGYENGVLKYELPVPMAFSGDLNVSYSGLKTAVKQLINKLSSELQLSEERVGEIAAVFEAAAIKMLTLKLGNALEGSKFNEVWLGGGVVASDYFRAEVAKVCEQHNVELRMPVSKKLMTDNAAMIGVAAGLKLMNGIETGVFTNPSKFILLDRDPILSL
jgi:N6-L-threonylcarbamoyladenine synthase